MIEQPVRFIDRAAAKLDADEVSAVSVAARRMAGLRTTAYSEFPGGDAITGGDT